jgi:hypothetical protein
LLRPNRLRHFRQCPPERAPHRRGNMDVAAVWIMIVRLFQRQACRLPETNRALSYGER